MQADDAKDHHLQTMRQSLFIVTLVLLMVLVCRTAAAQLPADLPTDPAAIADYLEELLPPGGAPITTDPLTGIQARDFSAYDEYDGIWSELDDSVKDQIREIWEFRQEEELERLLAAAERRERALSVQLSQELWVNGVANFFVAATGDIVSSPEDNVGEQLIESRLFYLDKLEALAEERQYLTTHIESAGVELLQTQAALDKATGVLWNDADADQLEKTANALQDNIDYMQLQLAAANAAQNRTLAEAANYERTLVIRGLQDSGEARAAEEERRYQEVVRLTNELAANRIQLVEGLAVWDARIEEVDDALREDLEETRDVWLAVQQSELYVRGQQLMNQYQLNAVAGVGPANHAELMAEVLDRGLDVGGVLEIQATEQRDDTARYMLDRVTVMAGGTIRSDDYDYDFYDFASDAADGIYEAHFTVDGGVRYWKRVGNYGGGVVDVGVDAVAGTLDLVWEVHDTIGELYLPSVFGDENLAALYGAADMSYSLADEVASNTAIAVGFEVSAPQTEAIYDVTQGLWGHSVRRFENANEYELSRWTGVGVGTLATIPIAPEAELLKGAMWAGRAMPKIIKPLRLAQRGDSAVDVAQAVARVDDLANRPPPGNALPAPDDIPPGFADAPTPVSRQPDGTGLADEAVPGRPAAAMPGPTAPRPPQPDLSGVRLPTARAEVLPASPGSPPVIGEGSVIRIGDREYRLGKLIGSGGFSTVYRIEGSDKVIKVTRRLERDPFGERTASMFLNDAYGNAVLSSLGPDVVRVPAIHDQARLINTLDQFGFVTVTDYIPEQNLIKQLQAAGRWMPTAKQQAAIDRFKQRLADMGYVWMDGKGDNFAIGSDGLPIVIDGGGLAKFSSPDVAHQVLRDLEAPPPDMLQAIMQYTDPGNQALAWRSKIDEKYAGEMVVEEMQALGMGFEGLANLPYTPLGPLKRQQLLTGTLGGQSVPTPVLPRVEFPDVVSSARATAGAVAPVGAAPAPVILPPAAVLQDCLVPPGSAFQTRVQFGFAAGGPPRWRGTGSEFRGARVFQDPLFANPPVPAPLNPLPVPRTSMIDNPGPYCDGARFEFPGLVLRDAEYLTFDIPQDSLVRAASRPICFGALGLDRECPANSEQAYVIPAEFADNLPGLDLLPNPYRTEQAVNDPHYERVGSWGQAEPDQWAIRAAGVHERILETITDASARPVVAVIDTGLAWSHPDIDVSSLWRNDAEIVGNGIDDDGNGYVDDIVGWNFVEDNNLPWDSEGHGTLVAGIIAASSNNGIGIAGVNPAAKIMVLRALDELGRTRASYLAEAVVYAANNGAQVINLSVGGATITMVEQLAIDYARDHGIVVVAAAGNDGIELTDYGPAGNDGVVTVAASGYDGSRLSFSNWGNAVDITAPGEDVLGLRALNTDLMAKFSDIDYTPGANIVGEAHQYYRATGTSFAAPIVAGAASLLLARNPQLSAQEVERMIVNSAIDIGSPGIDRLTGYGALDVGAATSAEPDFFIEGRIRSVAGVKRNGQTLVQVVGTANANKFQLASLQLGAGREPTEWKSAGDPVLSPVENGVIAEIDAAEFSGSPTWTLRLEVTHENGTRREARFELNLQ